MPRVQDDSYVLPPRPAGEPAGRWLCARLRADIQAGRLGPGVRIPSSRRLAALARTARGTVVAALEQLESEGYLFTRRRSGTFVARRLATGTAKPAGAAKARARV